MNQLFLGEGFFLLRQGADVDLINDHRYSRLLLVFFYVGSFGLHKWVEVVVFLLVHQA